MSETENDSMADGLKEFYSSQVKVLLAQYRNINNLLGPTTHNTHPGTHCEVLLRNLLRRYLPNGMSADKGFIYGRVDKTGKNQHGPEIDILIHDEAYLRPLFRVDDFVIVHPKSVIALIEVKTNLENGTQLEKGIFNVVAAKQHLHRLRLNRVLGSDTSDPQPISALVAFEGNTSEDKYRTLISAALAHHSIPELEDELHSASVILPDFVGSLLGSIACRGNDQYRRSYYTYDSAVGEFNFSLQILLAKLSEVLTKVYNYQYPFALRDVAHTGSFEVGPPIDHE